MWWISTFGSFMREFFVGSCERSISIWLFGVCWSHSSQKIKLYQMILDQENIITIVVSDVRALQQYDMKNKVESNWMIIRRNVTNQAQSKRGMNFKFRRTAIFDKPRFKFCKNSAYSRLIVKDTNENRPRFSSKLRPLIDSVSQNVWKAHCTYIWITRGP